MLRSYIRLMPISRIVHELWRNVQPRTNHETRSQERLPAQSTEATRALLKVISLMLGVFEVRHVCYRNDVTK